jgi:hypothetical protein
MRQQDVMTVGIPYSSRVQGMARLRVLMSMVLRSKRQEMMYKATGTHKESSEGLTDSE